MNYTHPQGIYGFHNNVLTCLILNMGRDTGGMR